MLSGLEHLGNVDGSVLRMDEFDKLRALVAQARSGDATAFREMQEQARNVDRRRIEIAARIAVLVGAETCPQ